MNYEQLYRQSCDELQKAKDEMENLRSTMVAAAEEIHAHWNEHCDNEGYGPSNLMHRLEKGIAANYLGYKVGAFNEMDDKIKRLKADKKEAVEFIEIFLKAVEDEYKPNPHSKFFSEFMQFKLMTKQLIQKLSQ